MKQITPTITRIMTTIRGMMTAAAMAPPPMPEGEPVVATPFATTPLVDVEVMGPLVVVVVEVEVVLGPVEVEVAVVVVVTGGDPVVPETGT